MFCLRFGLFILSPNGSMGAVPPCAGLAAWAAWSRVGAGAHLLGYSRYPSENRTGDFRLIRLERLKHPPRFLLGDAATRRRSLQLPTLMVYGFVKVGVQQHQVVIRILTATVFGVPVVPVPTRFGGDCLMTVCAFARPSAVKVRQKMAPDKLSDHFLSLTTLKIYFPLRVTHIRRRFDARPAF